MSKFRFPMQFLSLTEQLINRKNNALSTAWEIAYLFKVLARKVIDNKEAKSKDDVFSSILPTGESAGKFRIRMIYSLAYPDVIEAAAHHAAYDPVATRRLEGSS
jgi:hypothetical protein